jgi:thiamine biosynthesis lipoprotein
MDSNVHTTSASARSGFRHVEHVMGTAVSFDVRDGTVDSGALPVAVDWLHHVDRTYSPYIHDSPISRLGRAEITLDDLDDEILAVLARCEALNDDSDGAFDAFDIPAPNGTTLDPSGYVKGWSIECAAHVFERHGHANFTINAGGDIAVRGEASPGTAWRVGIRDPDDSGLLARVHDVNGPAAVATSGTYERGAHIIDPRTGQAVTDLASVTVVGPDLADADAFATIVFVLGHEGLTWIATHEGYEAMAITHDGVALATSGFAAYDSSPRSTADARVRR